MQLMTNKALLSKSQKLGSYLKLNERNKAIASSNLETLRVCKDLHRVSLIVKLEWDEKIISLSVHALLNSRKRYQSQ